MTANNSVDTIEQCYGTCADSSSSDILAAEEMLYWQAE
jgi:hypothetical protein